MAKYRVNVSESAENDLKEVVRYITSQLSAPISAPSMIKLFEEAMAGLADMPQHHPFIADERLAQLGYRKVLLKSYVVFYTIDDGNKVVDIERILYGRRDWIRIL